MTTEIISVLAAFSSEFSRPTWKNIQTLLMGAILCRGARRVSSPLCQHSCRGRALARILSTGWQKSRIKAELPQVRVHDLKHTFGRRLRAAGVSFEDRQDLLGHRSGRITTHYSSAELQNLYEAANRVCEKQRSGVILTLLRNTNFKTRRAVSESKNAVSL